jgi:hypothetical protein
MRGPLAPCHQWTLDGAKQRAAVKGVVGLKPRSPEDRQMLTAQRIDGSHDLAG